MTKAEIRRECTKLYSSYSPIELFQSESFTEMLQATINATCESLGRIPALHTVCDQKMDLTAMTNGQIIMVNTQGPLIKDLPTYWEQYIANIGHVVHEVGHVLFTDFENQNPMIKDWTEARTFYYYPGTPAGKEALEVAKKMQDNPHLRKLYTSLMVSITNTFEDAYIENRLRDNFDGLAVAGLEKVNSEMMKKAPKLDEILSDCLIGKRLPIMAAEDIMLARYVCREELSNDRPLTGAEQDLLDKIEKVLRSNASIMNELCYEQDGLARCNLFNHLFVNLFSLMPDLPEEKKEGGEDGDGDGSSDISEEMANGMSNAQSQSNDQKGKSKAPTGNTKTIKQSSSQAQRDEAKEKAEHAKELSEKQSSMQRELEKAIKDAILDKVLKKDEEEHESKLSEECSKIAGGRGSSPNFRGYTFRRSNPDKEEYRRIYRHTKKTSGNLVRKINNILKDRQADSTEGGFLMGQRFNAKDVVNRDGKYFSRQTVPDGRPEVAFGILVDQSGSMGGTRIETAKRVTILLEEALRKLNIPLLIAGHSEANGKCRMTSFVDFDTQDGKDSFRLSTMFASGCNIDGAAITYAGEKLLKRAEKIKVLIVISDGQPTGMSYYSKTSCDDDTRLAVDYYRRKGLIIFGAVIDNFDKIKKLYGDSYCFDCKDDGALEKELVKLIKKYVLVTCSTA